MYLFIYVIHLNKLLSVFKGNPPDVS